MNRRKGLYGIDGTKREKTIMPREVVAIAARCFILRDYEDLPLKPNEVRIRSRFSAEKHGTMLPIYQGLSPLSEKAYDPKLGLFLPKETAKGWTASFPMPAGNMTVGVITDVGSTVTRFSVGDRVYGYLPIKETHTASVDRIYEAPPELSDEQLVCIDPATVALMAIREGNVRIGDTVAVFGLGAIGLMAVQIAKMSGSILVVGVEPIEKRRGLAQRYGAEILFDPRGLDVGLEIRKATQHVGVDVSLEMSGSYQALHQAVRATRYGGTIVPVSWYHGEAEGLNLGEEWHFNRQILVSGARVESEPYRDHPRWDRKRVYETVTQLLGRSKLNVDGILDPVVKFEEVIEAYSMIQDEPEKTIKLGAKYE